MKKDKKQSNQKKRDQYYLFIFAFIISRLVVVNPGPVFFDSPEYLTRLSENSLLTALSTGHLPLHSGYVFALWPFFKIGNVFQIGGYLSMIFQIVLATLCLVSFFAIVKKLFNERTALLASALVTFNPIWWVTSVTVMMEGIYIPFFMFSVYFALRYGTNKKSQIPALLLSATCFAFSFFTHFGIILWTPLVIFISGMTYKKQALYTAGALFIAIFIASVINAYYVSLHEHVFLADAFIRLYTGKLGERGFIELSVHSIMAMIRTIIVPLLRNNTIIIVILASIGFLKLYQNQKKYFILFAVWLFPVLIANQWWDSLLFGRHTLPASFALSTLASIAVVSKKRTVYALFAYLLITVLPAVMLLKNPIPYIELSQYIPRLEQNGLYIESHFARPQTENIYHGTTVYVDEPGWKKDELHRLIMDHIVAHKPVYISSHALSEPYGLYSGPFLHSLSLSYSNPFVLQEILEKFTLKKITPIPNTDIDMYEIISYSPAPYPKVKNMKFDRRRIDYTDPLIQLWIVPHYLGSKYF